MGQVAQIERTQEARNLAEVLLSLQRAEAISARYRPLIDRTTRSLDAVMKEIEDYRRVPAMSASA